MQVCMTATQTFKRCREYSDKHRAEKQNTRSRTETQSIKLGASPGRHSFFGRFAPPVPNVGAACAAGVTRRGGFSCRPCIQYVSPDIFLFPALYLLWLSSVTHVPTLHVFTHTAPPYTFVEGVDGVGQGCIDGSLAINTAENDCVNCRK